MSTPTVHSHEPSLPTRRIFVCSPSDVADERAITYDVLKRVALRFAEFVRIEPVLWEHIGLSSHETFQVQIVNPAETDLVICILWSRLGTPLGSQFARRDGRSYLSGTEYEFETAVEACRTRGTPTVWVYRKTAEPPRPSVNDTQAMREVADQKDALDIFWKEKVNDGSLQSIHRFADSGQFERLIEQHLIDWLFKSDITPSNSITWSGGSPFRGLEVFDFEHEPVFFGRTKATTDVLAALRRQAAGGSAFVLVLGQSGSGKSSLVRRRRAAAACQARLRRGSRLLAPGDYAPSDGGDPLSGLAAALTDKDALPELLQDDLTVERLGDMLRVNLPQVLMSLGNALSRAARPPTWPMAPSAPIPAWYCSSINWKSFSICHASTQHREQFARALTALATSGRVWVVVTLRSDYYHAFAKLPAWLA